MRRRVRGKKGKNSAQLLSALSKDDGAGKKGTSSAQLLSALPKEEGAKDN